MRKYTSSVHLRNSLVISTILLAHASGQISAGPRESASCRRFVQEFYDWYIPFTQTEAGGRPSDIALRQRASLFNPDLLRALKSDSEAQARSKELVGLDLDPFAGSDPADHYEARRVTCKDARCSVDLWRASPTDTAAKTGKPEIVAVVALTRGHWEFQNFLYPDLGSDLVSVLTELREERRKH
jgi:hypothetical protein